MSALLPNRCGRAGAIGIRPAFFVGAQTNRRKPRQLNFYTEDAKNAEATRRKDKIWCFVEKFWGTSAYSIKKPLRKPGRQETKEDYRRMLDEMGDRIDAVVVATPDHSHTPAAAEVLRAGKPVLAEKPLTITAHEARGLRRLAAEHGVATSLGNQGTGYAGFRRGLELIRKGVIGPVERVHIWFSRGGRNFQQPPQGTHEVPEELDWNLWLGPVEPSGPRHTRRRGPCAMPPPPRLCPPSG